MSIILYGNFGDEEWLITQLLLYWND
jgi:hypothetical protein